MQFLFTSRTNDPIHVFNNFSLSTDLIFVSQTSLVMKPGVHSLPNSNCQHWIKYAMFDLEFQYPLLGATELKITEMQGFTRKIINFNWEKSI